MAREIIEALLNGIPLCSDSMTFIRYPVASASGSSTSTSSGILQEWFAKCETKLLVFVSSVEVPSLALTPFIERDDKK